MTTRYLGIDVGGTNSKLAVLASGGGPPEAPRLLATATIPTGPPSWWSARASR